jgi:hypothetical protein
MKLLASIKEKLGAIKKWSDKRTKYGRKYSSVSLIDKQTEKNPSPGFFDGMGPVTAREITKRRIDKYIIAEFGVEEFENSERYYVARISEVNGRIIHTLLVDKQNGMTRSLYRKDASL